MNISEKWLKWLLRFYPPLFFQRIWVQAFTPDFRGVDVKIARSIFNINYNKSIFGGTIYSAVDPFLPVLFFQIFSKMGYKVTVWQKGADIDFIKPAYTNLYFSIAIDEACIEEAKEMINKGEKFIKSFPVELKNKDGEVCAVMNSIVYVRKSQTLS